MDEKHAKRFFTALGSESLLQPLDAASPAERQLWRACELCTLGEYRIPGCPDPRGLGEQGIARLAARVLARDERIGDPADMQTMQPFWIQVNEERIGTLALSVREMGLVAPSLELASLYLLREHRGLGHGRRVIERLDRLASKTGLDSIRVETHWLWQPAVRFYLRLGWWTQNWKHSLRLVRGRGLPGYSVNQLGDRIDFVIGQENRPLIRATREGEHLCWRERQGNKGDDGQGLDLIWSARTTFSLWLAVAGWPLKRGDEQWTAYVNWIDAGMPEGLARKIQIFEALARRDGFLVETPRIPGLDYPDLEAL